MEYNKLQELKSLLQQLKSKLNDIKTNTSIS